MDRSSENEKREHPSVAALGADVTNSPMRSEGNTGGGYYKKLASFLWIALLAITAGLLFFTSSAICPNRRTKIFLVILTALAGSAILLKKSLLWKYRNKSGVICILLISAYASLASFGQRFFLSDNVRMHVTSEGIFYCVLGAVWFIPIISGLLIVLERLTVLPGEERRITKTHAKLIMFACLIACQLFVIWIVWPGGYANDTVSQLYQAIGINALNDWHPVMHTLLEKVVLDIFKNTGAIMAIQMLLFSWLLTDILMLGYERVEIPFALIVVFGCVFELLPNQVLTGCALMKDYPFSLAILWCGNLMANLVLDTPWSRKPSFYVCVALGLFLTLTLRHNGIMPALFVIMGCVVLTIREYSRLKLRLVAAVAAALCFFGIYKGPVMKALGAVPNAVSPYTTMLCAVGSCINKDLPLSDEANAIMQEVMPLEDWADYYSRYYGHDKYVWWRPEGSVTYDTSSITAKKAFRVYLEALVKYPDVIIKDRLDGCDIMWDVVQPSDSFNARNFFSLDPGIDKIPVDTTGWTQQENGGWEKDTKLALLYRSSANTRANDFLDMLLWRSGAYLITLLTLFLFWWKNRDGRFFYAALPMLGNIAASILVVYHQSFRYVWFIQPNVLMLIYLTIVFGKTVSKEERK